MILANQTVPRTIITAHWEGQSSFGADHTAWE